MATAPTEKAGQYLSFFIAGEEYALNILRVKELIQYAPVTRMPSLPPGFCGVLNLRGRVVPVLDVALRLGIGETKVTKWTCVVMFETAQEDGESGLVGLLADSVHQVIELKASDIEPPPRFGTTARAAYLHGVSQQDRKFVMLLDVDRLIGEQVPEPQAVAEPAAPEPTPEAAPAAVPAPEASPSPGATEPAP